MKKYLGRKINLRRLVALAGVFLCILTATSFLDRVWWVFDLTAHFRIQYAIALTTLTATCFLIRRNRFGIIFSVFAVINFWIVIPYCFFGQAPVSPKQVALRALLINVQSENDHYDLVEKFIRDCAPDIVVLEEMDNKWLMHLAALKTVYPHVCEAPKEDHSGIVLFSKLPLKNPETIYLGEAGSPSVTAEIEVGGRPIRILGTHPVPPVGSENTRLRDQQLRVVAEQVKDWRGSVLLLGDLNTTVWSHSFGQLLRESGLHDSGRGQGIQTTFPVKHLILRIGIDHCLISDDLHVLSRKVGSDVGSDHFPLLIELAVE